MEATDVFVTAGPNPRMRFKRVQCPMVEVGHVTDPAAFFRAVAEGKAMPTFGPRCDQEIIVFFKWVGICPVHGIVGSAEPWTDGPGGQM